MGKRRSPNCGASSRHEVVVSSGYAEEETLPLFQAKSVGLPSKHYTPGGFPEKVRVALG
jgi:hypothetical protein